MADMPRINTEVCTIYEVNEWMRDVVAATSPERRNEIISNALPENIECAGECLRVYSEERHKDTNSFPHGLSEMLALFDITFGVNQEVYSDGFEIMIICLAMPDVTAKTIEIHLKDGTYWPRDGLAEFAQQKES